MNGHKKNIIFKVVVIFLVTVVFGVTTLKLKKDYKNIKNDERYLREKLVEINNLCNTIYDDVEGNEKKYLKLVENEQDPLKKGIYSSALVQVYTIKSDYEKIIIYGNQAIENYEKIPGGEFLALAEKKYLSWAMLKVERYSESFLYANDLIDLLSSSSSEILTEEEVIDTEALAYTIFLTIYSEFELLDNAKIYYEKLNNIEMTESLRLSRGEKIVYSKMLYAMGKKDYELMLKYAEECYDVAQKNDAIKGVNTSDHLIINIGIANIKNKNYDKGLEYIKRAEKVVLKTDDKQFWAEIYYNYGEYYEGKNDSNKALEYYSKAMALYKKLEESNSVIESLEKVIEIKNKQYIATTEEYKEYYKLKRKVSENKELNKFVSKNIDINDKLNANRIEYFRRENEEIGRRNNILVILVITFFTMSLILVVLLSRLKSLLIKNKEKESRLKILANTDYLTGINSRAYGYKLIQKLMKNRSYFSLAILDIDNFKSINDNYGHVFGDEVLRNLTVVSEEILKEEKHISIRYGGEEFIIVFENKTPKETKKILDKIREEFNKQSFKNSIKVSFSAGISESKGKDIDNIIEEADRLLYKAKHEGKNKVLI